MVSKDENRVVLDISTSLDGFIAAPKDDTSRLHQWLFDGDTRSAHSDFFKLSPQSATVFDALVEATGSIITGNRTYQLTGGWGGSHPVSDKVFVMSRSVPDEIPKGATDFTFVTDGIASAVAQAKDAADGKKVYIMGGASVAQQCIRAHLLDEIVLHVVPVLLGAGTRLFDASDEGGVELERLTVVEAPGVTHLAFRVAR